MIVLKISNASEVVAANIGKFLERLTPDSFDQHKVEDIVMKKLVTQLVSEGVSGEVAAVDGLDINGKELVLQDRLRVRHREGF
jgi:hypothetical protein